MELLDIGSGFPACLNLAQKKRIFLAVHNRADGPARFSDLLASGSPLQPAPPSAQEGTPEEADIVDNALAARLAMSRLAQQDI